MSKIMVSFLVLSFLFLVVLLKTSRVILVVLVLETTMLFLIYFSLILQPTVFCFSLALITLSAIEAALGLSLIAYLMREHNESVLQFTSFSKKIVALN